MISGLIAATGFCLVLFLPGFLTTMIIFQKISFLDRLLLSLGISLASTITLGFLLSGGFFSGAKLTGISVWTGIITISASLALVHIFKS